METHCEILQLNKNTRIKIAPELGCNLFSWRIDGTEVFYSPENFLDSGNCLWGGNPLLFPSVGRTWKLGDGPPVPDEYSIYGMIGTYTMPIHGFAGKGVWRNQRIERRGTRLTAEYRFVPKPEVFTDNYPFRVNFSIRYTLYENTLQFSFTAMNKGDIPAPVAFGMHPFFLTGRQKTKSVRLPAGREVVLDPELKIPTGKTRVLESSSLQFKNHLTYDMAFQKEGDSRAVVRDFPAMGTVQITTDRFIEMFVVYSGEDTQFLCVEPWTKGLGTFSRLAYPGWEEDYSLPLLWPSRGRTVTVSYIAGE
ncbi:MAG: hypothetical protein K9L68_07475 [Spirochaetales bacterium]|nr:hypothetical protein [Spirochaetales bacterium]MCF7938421.1 hypothetical protein [Spirochaetales bacterium]